MRLVAPVILLSLVLLAPPALAQIDPAARGPLAATFGYFIGTWECKGGDPGARQMTATVTWHFSLHNTLVDERIDVPPVGKATGYRSGGYSSYDAQKKKIFAVTTDEYGGWDVTSTTGWTGKTLTFRDVANDETQLGFAADTKVSPNEFNHVRYSKGKVVFKAHCLKSFLPQPI
jgi:hypothetical protein